jgi:hypothetical protein
MRMGMTWMRNSSISPWSKKEAMISPPPIIQYPALTLRLRSGQRAGLTSDAPTGLSRSVSSEC